MKNQESLSPCDFCMGYVHKPTESVPAWECPECGYIHSSLSDNTLEVIHEYPRNNLPSPCEHNRCSWIMRNRCAELKNECLAFRRYVNHGTFDIEHVGVDYKPIDNTCPSGGRDCDKCQCGSNRHREPRC
jgi:hypothetical protein